VILTVPGLIPDTTPELFTVAIVVLLLLQVPPLGVLPNVVVAETHTVRVPVIDVTAGIALTVIPVVATHPKLLV
jgi:hypothetical protein